MSTKNKVGSALIILGIAAVIAAVGLLLWNINEDRHAEQSVMNIMPKLEEQREQASSQLQDIVTVVEYEDDTSDEMTVKDIDGYGYIGSLSFPTMKLDLPVMETWDYKRLKIAPCRYSGSAKTDNLVIAAHNYSRHFGSLKSLQKGDKVYFTDMDNKTYTYEVAETETLAPTAIDEMINSAYDLTLFTCTYGGKSRVTVRCTRVE
jgi:sortase A